MPTLSSRQLCHTSNSFHWTLIAVADTSKEQNRLVEILHVEPRSFSFMLGGALHCGPPMMEGGLVRIQKGSRLKAPGSRRGSHSVADLLPTMQCRSKLCPWSPGRDDFVERNEARTWLSFDILTFRWNRGGNPRCGSCGWSLAARFTPVNPSLSFYLLTLCKVTCSN